MSYLQHQAIRDLAWCCQSSPLLSQLPDQDIAIWPAREDAGDEDWLIQWDQKPDELLNALAALKSTRLGIYYETLWHFYWKHRSDWHLLAHNLQVTHLGKTLGAFDFILRNKEHYWHVETAVKFYLGVPLNSSRTNQAAQTRSEWHQWIGPHCNDRLDIKLDHLLRHQLPLSKNELAQQLLANLVDLSGLANTEIPWRNALCLQGYLFYPAHAHMAPPSLAHPQHAVGTWWHLQDFLARMEQHVFDNDYWMILPRDRWLSAAHTDDIHELRRGDDLQQSLQHWVGNNQRPQLLAAMIRTNGLWKEIKRGFVVPDHWPWTD